MRSIGGVFLLVLVMTSADVRAMATLPPITDIQIHSVRTSAAGIEQAKSSQLLTKRNHGGNTLEFTTYELGFGTTTARYNTINATQIWTQAIVSGQTVIGWRRGWRVRTTVTSGRITVQSRSQNFPWNTMSDSLNVK